MIEHFIPSPSFVTAQTYIRDWPTFSKPCLVTCDDGNNYVIKGAHLGKAVCNEQIVARLGMKIGAPVSEPSFVKVSKELINLEPKLSHFSPGICHGNVFHANYSDRSWLDFTQESYNRPRFASLAVLYGWMFCGDSQLIYSNLAPHLVLSVDHGHFFPGGPNWQMDNLPSHPHATCEDAILTVVGLTKGEVRAAVDRLEGITKVDISEAVAMPPIEWGLTAPERVAIGDYLWIRREQVIQSIGA